jgi:GR25 family glycosyltransferase involved in LPS biosynthesis
MPVCQVTDVLNLLNQFALKSSKKSLTIQEWCKTITVVDKFNWSMRLKFANKIYEILKQLKNTKYDLTTWRLAYKCWHAIGDWYTQGHPQKLYEYDQNIIDELSNHFNSEKAKTLPVILTMTSCKRFDLLSRTIDSMVKNILDLKQYVREWIIIDDNSSEQDKKLMQSKYPFAKFIFKGPSDKGHPRSMNMLHDILTGTDAPYNLHIEDDWEFWYPDNFIGKCIKVVEQDKNIGQCLINFEYTEDQYTAMTIWNRDMFEVDDTRYFIHEYFVGDRLKIEQNHLGGASSMYWPHFSFRVGITKNSIYKTVGKFSEQHKHFEMDYANKYVEKGFKTAMLDCCYSTHIGRRTYERDTKKLNAYDLNNEQQFGDAPKEQKASNDDLIEAAKKAAAANKPLKGTIEDAVTVATHSFNNVRIYVLNLERRPERLVKFVKQNNAEMMAYNVFNGVDGKSLQPNGKIQKIFETGDYNFRRGIVGCAYSHLKIWTEFLKGGGKYCIVLEDDVKLCKQFLQKTFHLIKAHRNEFDILYLHWNPYPHVPEKEQWEMNYAKPIAELWDTNKTKSYNMGSGAGYLLTRKAAKYLIEWINVNGMPNAVDWVMMLRSDLRIMYSKPKLVFVDCFQNNGAIQSDIQLDYDSVKFKKQSDWLKNEVDYWKAKQVDVVVNDVYPVNDWKAVRNSVYVCSKDITVPKDFLVKWYICNDKKIIVPDRFINKEAYERVAWMGDRINMISP